MSEKFVIHKFAKFNNKKVIFCTADFGGNKTRLQDKLSEESLLEDMLWLKQGSWDYFIIENNEAQMVRSIDLHYLFLEGYYCVINKDIEDNYY